MKLRKPPEKKRATHPIDDLKEGYKYSFSFKPIRDIIFLMAFVSLTGASALVLMPLFAGGMLHGGPQTLGLLMGSLGAGAVIGAIYLASRKDTGRHSAVISAATAVFGAGLFLLPFAGSIWPAMAALAAAGAGMMLQSSASNTIVQSLSDDRLRGRVLSFYLMAVTGFGPLGNLLTGLAARSFGVKPVIFSLGILTMAGASVFTLRNRK
jgi:MFS family permease